MREWDMSDPGTIRPMFDQIVGGSLSMGGKLHVRSAINPMLWLSALSVLLFVLAYFARDTAPLETVLLCVAPLPILAAVIGFIYFAIRSPEKLQSEEFQLQQEAMRIIGNKGAGFSRLTSEIETTSNPEFNRALPGTPE